MPNTPLFSILHTSARPDEWDKVYRAWLDNADDPENVEYVLVVDHDWGFKELPVLRPQDRVMWQKGVRHCYVEGVNRAAANSTGKILVVNADDQFPCKDWDHELLDVLDHKVENIDSDFVILPSTGTPDEHVRRIAVMPILSRTRYEKYGHVFYPMYESMFSDNDFLAHARHDGVVIEAKHLMFPHMHPICVDPTLMGSPNWLDSADNAYKVQNREQAYHIGYAIFNARTSMRFGDGMADATTHSTRPKLVLCLPGENYAAEWVTQFCEILGQLSAIYEIVPLFSWSTNVYVTRQCLAETAASLKPDYVVWIDDDNIVAPGQIQRLINGINAGRDIVAGWCWLQSERYQVVDKVSVGKFVGPAMSKAEGFTYSDLMSGTDDVKPIGWTGFPIVAMRGDVLTRIPKNPFHPIMSDEYPWGMSGEDVGFCYIAGKHDISIFVDRTVKVLHLKRKPDEPATVPSVAGEGSGEPQAALSPAQPELVTT